MSDEDYSTWRGDLQLDYACVVGRLPAHPDTALGRGILWPLFDTGLLGWNRVSAQPTLEQWPGWAKQPLTWRVRRQDERVPDVEDDFSNVVMA